MIDLFLIGSWLGLVQTGLGFSLLAGAGASPVLFFVFLGAWIGGGALGAVLSGDEERPFLFFAGASSAASSALLWLKPFFPGAWLFVVAAAFFCGVYAARAVVLRALPNSGRALFWENNGFLLGLATGLALLYFDAAVLAAAAVLLWLFLFRPKRTFP